MSKMSFEEFHALVKYIAENNSPFTAKYPKPNIKYIDPTFDMRTMDVFAVSFRCFGQDDISFHTQNECRDLPETLEQRIRKWLDTPIPRR